MHTQRVLALGFRWALISLGMVMLGMLSSCGGGGGDAPPLGPVNADPTGYYENTGTLTFKDTGGNVTATSTDLQAMIYNNRFIMASKVTGYYYDGPITVSGNTITGNLIQFAAPGSDSYTATLTATVNADKSITGTVTHSNDNVADAFTLTYASGRANATIADVANTQSNSDWDGTLYNVTAVNGTETLTIQLTSNATGSADLTTVKPMTLNGNFGGCNITGTLTPITGTSLFNVSFNANHITLQSCSFSGGPFLGFAALRMQTTPNDTLVIAAYYNDMAAINHYSALFGEFQ